MRGAKYVLIVVGFSLEVVGDILNRQPGREVVGWAVVFVGLFMALGSIWFGWPCWRNLKVLARLFRDEWRHRSSS